MKNLDTARMSFDGIKWLQWGYLIGDIKDQKDLKLQFDEKIDKEEGKTLSSNDFTNLYKDRLDTLSQAVIDIVGVSLHSDGSNWLGFNKYLDGVVSLREILLPLGGGGGGGGVMQMLSLVSSSGTLTSNYDGSSLTTVNITPLSIGAEPSLGYTPADEANVVSSISLGSSSIAKNAQLIATISSVPTTIELPVNGVEEISNKETSLSTSSTKYPTSSAVTALLQDFVKKSYTMGVALPDNYMLKFIDTAYQSSDDTYHYNTISRDLSGIDPNDKAGNGYGTLQASMIAPNASTTSGGFMTKDLYQTVVDDSYLIQTLMGSLTYVVAKDFMTTTPTQGLVGSLDQDTLSGWAYFNNPNWIWDLTNNTRHIPHGLLIKNLYKDDGGGGSTSTGSDEWVYNWNGYVIPGDPTSNDAGGNWVNIGLFDISLTNSTVAGLVKASLDGDTGSYDGTLWANLSGVLLLNGYNLVEVGLNKTQTIGPGSTTIEYPSLAAVYSFVNNGYVSSISASSTYANIDYTKAGISVSILINGLEDQLPQSLATDLAKFLVADLVLGHSVWHQFLLLDIPKSATLNRVLVTTTLGSDAQWSTVNIANMTTGVLKASQGGTGVNLTLTVLKGTIVAGNGLLLMVLVPSSGVDGQVLTVDNASTGGLKWAAGGGGGSGTVTDVKVNNISKLGGTTVLNILLDLSPLLNPNNPISSQAVYNHLKIADGTTTGGVTHGLIKFWTGSQQNYNSITTYDDNTLYLINLLS